jgi:hypothetical protein
MVQIIHSYPPDAPRIKHGSNHPFISSWRTSYKAWFKSSIHILLTQSIDIVIHSFLIHPINSMVGILILSYPSDPDDELHGYVRGHCALCCHAGRVCLVMACSTLAHWLLNVQQVCNLTQPQSPVRVTLARWGRSNQPTCTHTPQLLINILIHWLPFKSTDQIMWSGDLSYV